MFSLWIMILNLVTRMLELNVVISYLLEFREFLSSKRIEMTRVSLEQNCICKIWLLFWILTWNFITILESSNLIFTFCQHLTSENKIEFKIGNIIGILVTFWPWVWIIAYIQNIFNVTWSMLQMWQSYFLGFVTES